MFTAAYSCEHFFSHPLKPPKLTVLLGIPRTLHITLFVINLLLLSRQLVATGAFLAIVGSRNGEAMVCAQRLAVGLREIGRGRQDEGIGAGGFVARLGGRGRGEGEREEEGLHFARL